MKKFLLLMILLSMALLPVFSFSYANEPALLIHDQPEDLLVEQFLADRLSITTVDGLGEPVYQWYVNDARDYAGATAIHGAQSAEHEPDTSQPGLWYYYVVVTATLPDAEPGDEPVSEFSEIVSVTVEEAEPPQLTEEELKPDEVEETEEGDEQPLLLASYQQAEESDLLPLRFHYEGYWRDDPDDPTYENNTVSVAVGGRLAIQAVYYSGREVSDDDTSTSALPAGQTASFQWYESREPVDTPIIAPAESHTPISAEELGQGNIFMPNTGLDYQGETTYYYAALTLKQTGVEEPTILYSEVATVEVRREYPGGKEEWLTPAEKSGWRATTSSQDVYDFCRMMAEESGGRMRLQVIGQTSGLAATPVKESTDSQPIPMLVISDQAPGSLAEVGDKAVILVNCNIHSGEVEGKESMLIFAREVVQGQHDDLLKEVVILLIPNLNADGNDNLGTRRNSTQYAPIEVGTRFTGGAVNENIDPDAYNYNSESHNFYNINRDMTKLDAPEATALVQLMNEWDPVIFIDAHATNGTLMQHAITYNWGLHPNTDTALLDYNRDIYCNNALGEDSRLGGHGKVSVPYGNFSGSRKDDTFQLRTFEDYPRYTTNYAGLRNRLALLLEVYSHDPYTVRVDTQYDCILGAIEAVANDKATIKQLIAEADQRSLNRAVDGINPEVDFVALNSEMAYLDDIEFLTYKITDNAVRNPTTNPTIYSTPMSYALTAAGNGLRSGTLYVDKETITVPYYGLFKPTGKETMGAYYLLDADSGEAAALLDKHGIEYTRLSGPLLIGAQSFQWYKATTRNQNATLYEGHNMNRFAGSWQTPTAAQEFPAGTYLVSTAQVRGSLAALLLEPASVDGAISWNFFDAQLENYDDPKTVRSRYISTGLQRQVSQGVFEPEDDVAIPVFKVNSYHMTGLFLSAASFSSSGGSSEITVTGFDLTDGVIVAAFNGQTEALRGRTVGEAGNPTHSQKVTLTFPANSSSSAVNYRVRVSLDGGLSWQDLSANVTVGARTGSGGGSGGSSGSRDRDDGGSQTSATTPPATQEISDPQTPLTASPTFTDVPQSHWAYTHVMYLLDKGYVTGKTATTFAPNDAITRAEFITILARMSQETLPSAYQGPFTDISGGSYYEQAVAWAVAAGIVNGTSEASFSPNQPILRQEIAAMIVRYLEHLGVALPQTDQSGQFSDAGQIASYAQEAVGLMQQAAIISGYEDGSFRPLNQANRAEVAKMLALVDALN